MTAALVLAARVVLAAAGGLAFAAAFAAAVYWAGFGPQDARMLGFLAAMCAVTVVAAAGLYALQPKKAPACPCPCPCPRPGVRDDVGTPGWCIPCRMEIHMEA